MIVDIWSDVICPWCYIGKRRFEKALERFEHSGEVQVRWHSYQLNPNAARDGSMSALEAFCAEKGVPEERAKEMFDHVAEIAATEGLTYRLDLAKRGNTFDAHRLIHHAATRDLADAAQERLFAAYFTEGADINDHGELINLAVGIGLDASEVAEVLASDAHAKDVSADIAQAGAYGITGVPFFVVDGRFGISGAQDPEGILQTLEHAWAQPSPLEMSTGDGVCGHEGCATPDA